MQLVLVEHPNSEIVSLEETKNYLRIDHDYDDALLNMLIKSTRIAMESIIQKSVMFQIWKYIVDQNSVDNSDSERRDVASMYSGIMKIPLPKPPVAEIVSVEVKGEEVENSNYRLMKNNSAYCLFFSYAKVLRGKPKFPIAIIYKAGISDKVENIPYQLKLANLMLIANAYQERYSYNQNSVISQGVKQLLGPFLNLRIF